jgi:hypothetical protein
MKRLGRKVRIMSAGDAVGWWTPLLGNKSYLAVCFCGCTRTGEPTDDYAAAARDREWIILEHLRERYE